MASCGLQQTVPLKPNVLAHFHLSIRTHRCSQRVQRMTEQTLVFKSVKKVMDKLLSILAEVEQAHRAFFHSFESAVQASLQVHFTFHTIHAQLLHMC